MAFGVLIPTAAAGINAFGNDWGTAGLNNAGPHGLSEILYCFSEGTGNNGSAFAGLTMNPVTNTVLAFVILMGRYFPLILPSWPWRAGLSRKKSPPSAPAAFRCRAERSSFCSGAPS